MQMKHRLAAVVAATAGLLTACATETLRSAAMPDPKMQTVATAGQPYYLPRVLLPITVTAGKAKGGDGGGKPAGAAATGTTVNVTNNQTVNVTQPKPPGGDNGGGGGQQVSVKIGAAKYVADPREMYFLEYRESGASDDRFDIKVDQNGLLQSTESKSRDRSGDIALKFVELAGQVARIGVSGGPRFESNVTKRTDKPPCELTDETIELLVDPEAVHSDNKAEKIPGAKIEDHEVKFDGQFKGLTIGIRRPTNTRSAAVPAAEAQGSHGGVVFRAAVPYEVTVAFDPKQSPHGAKCELSKFAQQLTIMAPNGGPTFRADVSRAALVEKTVTLSIQDGMLTGTKVDKPSEFLAAISLPVDIAKAIVAIPADLLKIRVEEVKAQSGLTEAEANLLKQQLELIKQQNALEAAQATR
jgi:hypothetical protein